MLELTQFGKTDMILADADNLKNSQISAIKSFLEYNAILELDVWL